MKISLSIQDRLVMSSIFPEKSNMKNQLLMKNIDEKVKFSLEEINNIGLQMDDKGFCKWDSSKARDREFEFTIDELSFLSSLIDKLDSEEKITRQLLSLCQKIKGV